MIPVNRSIKYLPYTAGAPQNTHVRPPLLTRRASASAGNRRDRDADRSSRSSRPSGATAGGGLVTAVSATGNDVGSTLSKIAAGLTGGSGHAPKHAT